MEIFRNWKIHVLALILVVIAESIGTKKIPLGPGVLLLLPMLYAMAIGAFLSWPKLKLLNEKEMNQANAVMSLVVMLFVTKLGTLLGPSLPKLIHSGLALSLQELGHFFGTVIIGLPVALLLGVKREAIGATFSIDREPNIAIIAEKFGMDSPEGRGVMAIYICGTLFGAAYLGLIAGYLATTGLFHPLALAMGAGVGSGSMMAAASGAIAAALPEHAKDVATFAAASNLLTTVVGIYFALFVSLPVTEKLYDILEPRIGKKLSKVGG
ncbi:MAG TPA: DUF3100 domain-containing protein [Desulfotomaculum sp.]|nr:DUF3100 domain-containing protein [Desulfotomaculum sp.]